MQSLYAQRVVRIPCGVFQPTRTAKFDQLGLDGIMHFPNEKCSKTLINRKLSIKRIFHPAYTPPGIFPISPKILGKFEKTSFSGLAAYIRL